MTEMTEKELPELVVVVGPTASGKTALAMRMAEELGGEVVGADSVQIYRRFDAGAGKPTLDERESVPSSPDRLPRSCRTDGRCEVGRPGGVRRNGHPIARTNADRLRRYVSLDSCALVRARARATRGRIGARPTPGIRSRPGESCASRRTGRVPTPRPRRVSRRTTSFG